MKGEIEVEKEKALYMLCECVSTRVCVVCVLRVFVQHGLQCSTKYMVYI